MVTPVRLFIVCLALAGCQVGLMPDMLGMGSGSGSGSGSAGIECRSDGDCAAAAAKCCDCPTFAVPVGDPAHRACASVMCPMSVCPANVRAACAQGACVLACVPMVCTASCADGYALDAAGCLSCACQAVANPSCTVDGDCARVRADCCGCGNGGADTAVPTADVAQYDASLGCPPSPSCPSGNTCAPDLAPHCVQGACELVPALPAGACGRPDLPACPAGQVCTVNANASATREGVGVCM